MDGGETAREIRKAMGQAQPCFIALRAGGSRGPHSNGRSRLDCHLVKPVGSPELFEAGLPAHARRTRRPLRRWADLGHA